MTLLPKIATTSNWKKKREPKAWFPPPPPGVEGVVDGCYCGWDLRKA